MSNETEDVKTVALRLLYQVSILQRGFENSDEEVNSALFRLTHNISSFGLVCETVDELKNKVEGMCSGNFQNTAFGDDLLELMKVFDER